MDAFCQQWKITKLELFGSTLTDPTHARDVDLLVIFVQDGRWGLFVQNELARLFGRNVDLVSRRAFDQSECFTTECHLKQSRALLFAG